MCNTNPRRPSPITILVVIAFIGLMEGGARLSEPRVPPAATWGTPRVDARVDLMEGLSATGGADVVFLGSSVIEIGVDVGTFQDNSPWAEGAFNAGFSAASPMILELWAKEVVLPQLRPKVVVIGLVSRDMNDAGIVHATAMERYTNSEGRATYRERLSLAQRLKSKLADWSALFRIRRNLNSPYTFLANLANPSDLYLTELGHATIYENRKYTLDATLAERLTNRSLNDYSVGGEESQALRRLVDAAIESGAAVYIVDMPVYAQDYDHLHPNGTDDVASYRAEIASVAESSGATLLDANGAVNDVAYFTNQNHLNGLGADQVAEWLARMIPPPPNG